VVDLTFAGAGPWGAGVTRLSKAQGNENFWQIKQAIEALVATAAAGVGISNITISGRVMTIFMTDATEYAFTLPYATFTYRGVWQAAVSYAELDMVLVNGFGLFLVLNPHVSAGSFDPAAGNSAGDFYLFLCPTVVERYYAVSASTHEATTAQANGIFLCSNAGGCVVTLPDDLPDGSQLTYRQGGAGAVSFTATDTIQGMTGFDNQTNGVGSVATAKYMAGLWYLWGRLAPVSA
jgi:hypothetical protein